MIILGRWPTKSALSLENPQSAEAARAWLDDDFGIGDEPALIEAIRKDKRIQLGVSPEHSALQG